MTYQNQLDDYTKTELDNDYSLYRVIKSDVAYYKGGNNAIDNILSDFRSQIDKITETQLFIKGNRLFFTIDGIKFYTTLSCWAQEWLLIDEFITELSKYADNVTYLEGELD